MKKKNDPTGQPPRRKIQIKVDPSLETGVYSNTAALLHSPNEFILDFGVFVPGRPEIKVVSRVITHPKAAKQLMLALQRNIQIYEERFGEIELPKQPTGHPPMPGFPGPDQGGLVN